MFLRRRNLLAAVVSASGLALLTTTSALAQPTERLPIDRPTDVRGVRAACTGIGDREEREIRWNAYPLKLEVVGGYGQYLGDQNVTLVNHDGADVLHVSCDAPWLMMRLQPGRYTAVVRVRHATTKDVNFIVPREGQRDLIVRFPSLMTGQEIG